MPDDPLKEIQDALPPGTRLVYEVYEVDPLLGVHYAKRAPDQPLACGASFCGCDDSTDEADHHCVLDPHDAGQHKCACGAWGDC